NIIARQDLISTPSPAALPNQHLAPQGRSPQPRLLQPNGGPQIACKHGSTLQLILSRAIAQRQYPSESPRARRSRLSAPPFQRFLKLRVAPSGTPSLCRRQFLLCEPLYFQTPAAAPLHSW